MVKDLEISLSYVLKFIVLLIIGSPPIKTLFIPPIIDFKIDGTPGRQIIVKAVFGVHIIPGAVPNLFGEGVGAVVEGKLNDSKYLIADRILAKHDENYMPPQMQKILKKNVK